METRAGNKSSHPGDILKPSKRRTAAEIEAERVAKAQAKEGRELAKKQGIERTAQFEREDLVMEDKIDTSPRSASKRKASSQTNIEVDDTDDTDDTDTDDESSPINVEDSSAESDPPRPVKKAKASSTKKGKAKAASKKATEGTKGKLVASDTEQPEDSKPKKKSLREEINLTKEAQAKKLGTLLNLT
jgi:hypothetical protein